jgi:hypothetical protein
MGKRKENITRILADGILWKNGEIRRKGDVA